MMNSIHIERAQNGFVVCMDDPEIIAKNQKSKGTYLDPQRQFVFDDEKGVIAFITKNLGKIIPSNKDDYSSSFDTAVKEEKAKGDK